MQLMEKLHAADLRDMVKHIFEIDLYKSKIGDDNEVVVLSFTVLYEDPAKDLENFVEMGYDFVLDADVSPGETDDGHYKVFVEIERNRYSPEVIFEMLDGIKLLTGLTDFKFRYHKSFRSIDATLENLTAIVPIDKDSYRLATDTTSLDNFSNFFSNSYADEIMPLGESLEFKRKYMPNIRLNIIASGPLNEVYESITGPVLMEHADISEVLYYTKYLGNYNITKIGDALIFENDNWAVAMERKLL